MNAPKNRVKPDFRFHMLDFPPKTWIFPGFLFDKNIPFPLGRFRGAAQERGGGAEGEGHAELDLGAERERPPHRLQAPHREGRGQIKQEENPS